MFAIKNAIKNIYRYKNKYILFGVLYLVVITAASVCVNIFIQMGKITDNIIKEYASVVKFTPNMRDFADRPRFREDDYLAFKDVEHVEDIKIYRYNFASTYLKGLSLGDDLENSPVFLKCELGIGKISVPLRYPLAPVFVFGYNMNLLHLAADELKLESGRMFENDGEAVIAKNRVRRDFDLEHGVLQNWECLELGDRIALKNDDGFFKEFTVVGISEQNPTDDINTNRRMIHTTFEGAEYFDRIASEEAANYGIGPEDKTNSGRTESVAMGHEALIYLDDPDNYHSLQRKMLERGVWVESFFPNFSILVNLTRNLQTWSVVFMVLAGFVIVSVTVISTAILQNSRKYEMAVLRSVGMKKSRLILGYLAENLAFVWGITLVSLTAAQFAAHLFTGDVLSGIQSLVSPGMYGQLTEGANLELLLQNVGVVFGGTTGVVALSLVLACVNIVRFEPLKIFNKQY